MTNKAKPINWSDRKFKELLVYQRKYMWRDDTIDKLAAWFGFRPGLTVADIGCGLGFLGYTYWDYYGENGNYIGVDISSTLLHEALAASREWAEGGQAVFINGNGYNLPLIDNSVDLAMCQVMMMHLERPRDALSEMARIVKPGGFVVCLEPDNLSSQLIRRFWSMPELTVDEQLLEFKVVLIAGRGRLKRGRGDSNIAVKLVHMMAELGLTDIDARLDDNVWFIEPPYEGEVQQHRLKIAKRNMLEPDQIKFWQDSERADFSAGGGDPEEFERYVAIGDRYRQIAKEQFDKGEYFACGSQDMYIIKGRKR